MSLSEGDAERDARDLEETQHKGCFSQDASSREQLIRFARVASAFGDLMYNMLISRTDTTVVESIFVAQLLSSSVVDFDRHQGALREV